LVGQIPRKKTYQRTFAKPRGRSVMCRGPGGEIKTAYPAGERGPATGKRKKGSTYRHEVISSENLDSRVDQKKRL